MLELTWADLPDDTKLFDSFGKTWTKGYTVDMPPEVSNLPVVGWCIDYWTYQYTFACWAAPGDPYLVPGSSGSRLQKVDTGEAWSTLPELQTAWCNIAKTISDNLAVKEDPVTAYDRAMRIL